jgi:MoaA/NifB/PqqE/SkfB family radical SAM enzyme
MGLGIKSLKRGVKTNLIRFEALALHGRVLHLLPLSFQLSFSDKCNFRCQMCWIHSIHAKDSDNPEKLLFAKEKPKILEWDDFLTIVDGLTKVNVSSIEVVAKGEPLLNPNALEMFTYLRQKGISCSLITNGSLLSPAISEGLLQIGLSRIRISLDSVNEKNYKNIHGIQSKAISLSKTVDNIIHLRELRDRGNYNTNIGLSFVISRLNIDEIPRMIELSNELADSISFLNMASYKEIEQLRLTRKDYIRIRDEYGHEIMESLGIRNNWPKFLDKIDRFTKADNPRFWLKEYFSVFPCYIPFRFCVIHADGRVTPCCPSSYVVGNAIETSFERIWNSVRFKDFRSKAYRLPSLKREAPSSWCYCCDHF